MSWFAESARSTSLRRWSAAAGAWKGSNSDGACGSPAMSAAWSSVSPFAWREKYVWAAASIPYAWLP